MPTHYTGDENIRRALDAYIKFSRARKFMSDQTGRLLAEYGLTERQLGALEALYYLGPMYQREIGEKLLVTDGNMTMVINNLAKRGLVTRQYNEQDRRHRVIALTDQGRELIDELFPRHAQNIANLMRVLCGDEIDQLGQLCKKLGKQSREVDPSR